VSTHCPVPYSTIAMYSVLQSSKCMRLKQFVQLKLFDSGLGSYFGLLQVCFFAFFLKITIHYN